MKKIKDETKKKHLIAIKAEDQIKAAIIAGLRDDVFSVFPKATEEIKYGGIVFFMKGNLFGGLFAGKKHVSLEFSFGAAMKDPDNYLEGSGKNRRHLKFNRLSDIKEKKAVFYIKQAIIKKK